jgi:hypothetical protein
MAKQQEISAAAKPNATQQQQQKQSSPKTKSSSTSTKKMASEFTRGKSHAELLSQRSSLRDEIRSLPSTGRANVMAHLYGSGASKDLSKARLDNLRQFDANDRRPMSTTTTSSSSSRVKSSLHKRQSRPNSALQRQIHRRETKRLQNAISAADVQDILAPNTSGYVETENDMEKTLQLSQHQLKYDGTSLSSNVINNIYHLELKDHGPYILRYDRSGRHALLGGRGSNGCGGGGGHLAIVDQHTLSPTSEFFVQDIVRDACFLQDSSLLAVSQRQNVFIYDDAGAEVHRMGGHQMVTSMEFLPYHWLLGKYFSNDRLLSDGRVLCTNISTACYDLTLMQIRLLVCTSLQKHTCMPCCSSSFHSPSQNQ